MDNIHSLRAKIDLQDKKILEAISKRFLYSKKLVLIKQKAHLDIYDPKREKEIIFTRIELGKKLGIDPNFIKKLFILIISFSKKTQRSFFEEIRRKISRRK